MCQVRFFSLENQVSSVLTILSQDWKVELHSHKHATTMNSTKSGQRVQHLLAPLAHRHIRACHSITTSPLLHMKPDLERNFIKSRTYSSLSILKLPMEYPIRSASDVLYTASDSLNSAPSAYLKDLALC